MLVDRRYDVSLKIVPQGSGAISHTLGQMISYAKDPQTLLEARRYALFITKGSKTRYERAKRLFEWVRKNVEYVNDIHGIEHVQDPIFILEKAFSNDPRERALAAGDCDCHAVLMATLCISMGIPARYTVTEDSKSPGSAFDPNWAHVHAECQVNKKWIPLDTSMWFVDFDNRVPGRRSYIPIPFASEPGNVGSQRKIPFETTIEETPADRNLGWAQVASAGIRSVADISKALINKGIAKDMVEAQELALRLKADVQERYLTTKAELEAEVVKLALELKSREKAELESAKKFRQKSLWDTMLTATVAFGALGAIMFSEELKNLWTTE